MAALTFDTLLKGLKQGAAPGPVYYLHGEEDVLKEEAVRALLERAVDPAARDFNVDARAAAELDPEALRALVDTPPMVAERRAVVLRGIEQMKAKGKARDELIRYLDNPNPTTVLILVQGDGDAAADLATRATAVQVDRLSPDRVGRWAAHHAGRLGLTIEPEAGELLVAAAGGGPRALAQEPAERGAPAPGAGAAPAARPYGLRDWREEATRFARWAGGWTRADLGRALRRTLAADRALKGTGTSDERGIIVQLVVEFAVPAREAA